MFLCFHSNAGRGFYSQKNTLADVRTCLQIQKGAKMLQMSEVFLGQLLGANSRLVSICFKIIFMVNSCACIYMNSSFTCSNHAQWFCHLATMPKPVLSRPNILCIQLSPFHQQVLLILILCFIVKPYWLLYNFQDFKC